MDKSIKKVVSERRFSKIGSPSPNLAPLSQLPPTQLQPSLAFNKSFEKYEVIIKNQHIQRELKCIQWRSKTEFPIVKVLFYKPLHSKVINQCFVVQIGIQNFTSSLHSLPILPFYQVLYLLKESMIGFQRLFDRFGSFEVNDKMVLINKMGRCKVWFNENITLNSPSKKVKMLESEFKNKIVRLFEQKCIPSTLSRELFDKLKKTEKLIESISYIQHFSMEKRLVAPIKITAICESLGAKRIKTENVIQDLTLTKTSPHKLPQFITNIREKANLKARKYTDCCIKPMPVKRTVSVKNLTEQTPKSSKNTTNLQSTCEKKSSHEGNLDNKSSKPQIVGKFRTIKKSHSANITYSNLASQQNLQENNIASEETNFFEPAETLYRTKNVKPHQVKSRKFSQNVDTPKIRAFLHKEPKLKEQEQQKEKNSSGTMKEIKFPFHRINQVTAEQILQKTPQYNLLKRYGGPTDEDLISKNGWLKRINSLTVQSFRDTVFSISDGKETLADHLTLPFVQLDLLKTMGKELRGSLLINAE